LQASRNCPVHTTGFWHHASGAGAGADAVALAHAADVANNAALAQMAPVHPNVQGSMSFQLSEAFLPIRTVLAFGKLNQTWVGSSRRPALINSHPTRWHFLTAFTPPPQLMNRSRLADAVLTSTALNPDGRKASFTPGTATTSFRDAD